MNAKIVDAKAGRKWKYQVVEVDAPELAGWTLNTRFGRAEPIPDVRMTTTGKIIINVKQLI